MTLRRMIKTNAMHSGTNAAMAVSFKEHVSATLYIPLTHYAHEPDEGGDVPNLSTHIVCEASFDKERFMAAL
jgi:hypothetical protein